MKSSVMQWFFESFVRTGRGVRAKGGKFSRARFKDCALGGLAVWIFCARSFLAHGQTQVQFERLGELQLSQRNGPSSFATRGDYTFIAETTDLLIYNIADLARPRLAATVAISNG